VLPSLFAAVDKKLTLNSGRDYSLAAKARGSVHKRMDKKRQGGRNEQDCSIIFTANGRRISGWLYAITHATNSWPGSDGSISGPTAGF